MTKLTLRVKDSQFRCDSRRRNRKVWSYREGVRGHCWISIHSQCPKSHFRILAGNIYNIHNNKPVDSNHCLFSTILYSPRYI